jgi:hypothetical protein
MLFFFFFSFFFFLLQNWSIGGRTDPGERGIGISGRGEEGERIWKKRVGG